MVCLVQACFFNIFSKLNEEKTRKNSKLHQLFIKSKIVFFFKTQIFGNFWNLDPKIDKRKGVFPITIHNCLQNSTKPIQKYEKLVFIDFKTEIQDNKTQFSGNSTCVLHRISVEKTSLT